MTSRIEGNAVEAEPATDNSTTDNAGSQDNSEPVRETASPLGESGTDIAPTSRRGMLRHWPAALVVVALVITTVWSILQYRHDTELTAADREVGPAAADAAAAVLSYKPATVAADLARAHSHLTGDFAGYFEKLGTDVVIPAANGRHMSSTATVTATSVVSADSGHAVALVFVNQTTTADDLAQPTTMSSSLRLELVKVGEHWLVSKLDTV
ncbi:hypothetical protein [Nocardia macrotermitis]|uniref:Mce associated membrane protein n=1 Tax=Nocardia macrotermitis TaxID=2585198 RepID=A0A7K0D896_9NOCA|nr:hypothetical protein [Nocardia macrotermitis]MQY21771.1 hypothetical protein [Nocardia macrotermitis]